MNVPARLASLAIAAVITTASATAAHAVVVPVDPGAAISAGKVITGTGQNLPSLNATAPWDIGPFPATQVNAYFNSGAAAADQSSVTKAALIWTKAWVKSTC